MNATELISTNVVVGMAAERLTDVANRIVAARSHCCVVLSDDERKCLGTVRLADIAGRSSPGNRILADLVGQITPMIVRTTETAAAVAALFAQHGLGEAVVLDADDRYIGLITSESVLAWSVKELRLNSNPAARAELPPPTVGRYAQSLPVEVARKVVLVIEDHPDSRRALLHILRKRHFEVMECGSVAEGLSLAANHKFDLVISDIELPDGSGFGLMKELRRLHGLKGIAVTGQASEAHRTLSRDAGFSYHLKKPVSIRDLEQAITDVFSTPSSVVS